MTLRERGALSRWIPLFCLNSKGETGVGAWWWGGGGGGGGSSSSSASVCFMLDLETIFSPMRTSGTCVKRPQSEDCYVE